MIDRNSDTWITLRRKLDEEIERLRDALEAPGSETDDLRGRIAGLRWVIATAEPKPRDQETGVPVDYLRVREPEQS